jgi:very-short-patch-repair endonuclease
MKELDKTMYYRATPEIINNASMLRENMTASEKLLWERLKGKQICGIRFRRRHPIFIFIADFYCHEARLVVEIDGEIHNQQIEYDDGRSAEMEKFFIKIIRFINYEVENEIDEVIESITNAVNQRLKSPPWRIEG